MRTSIPSSCFFLIQDGTEVYRREPGKEAVHTALELTADRKYDFKITFLTEHANGLGCVWRTDIAGLLTTLVHKDKKFPHLIDDKGNWTVGPHLTVANAQLAASGEKGKYPKFAGNVLTVETRDFWRDASVSPSAQGYHYNRNAETYIMVGVALGRGMVKLLGKKD